MVDANTEPDGLIRTTTTFEIPSLFESNTRPVILIFERNRDPAALRASSLKGSGWLGVGDSEGTGVGVGVGSGVAAGTGSGVTVSGGDVSFGVVTSGVGCEVAGFVAVCVSEVAADCEAVFAESSETGAPPLVITAGPILSSSPVSEPFILR